MNYDKYIIEERNRNWDILKVEKILEKYKDLNIKINGKTINEIKDSWNKDVNNPDIVEVLNIYNSSLSVTQSFRSSGGKQFENIISDVFDKLNIDYGRELHIDDDGIINSKRGHKVDFIIPCPKYGDNINQTVNNVHKFTVLSCKTTLRERSLQDTKYKNCYLITLDKSSSYIDNTIVVDPTKKVFTKFLNKIKKCKLILPTLNYLTVSKGDLVDLLKHRILNESKYKKSELINFYKKLKK